MGLIGHQFCTRQLKAPMERTKKCAKVKDDLSRVTALNSDCTLKALDTFNVVAGLGARLGVSSFIDKDIIAYTVPPSKRLAMASNSSSLLP